MKRDELIAKLTEAGNKFNGRVTNESLAAQMRVVDDFVSKVVKFVVKETMLRVLEELKNEEPYDTYDHD